MITTRQLEWKKYLIYDKAIGVIRDEVDRSVIEFLTRVVPFQSSLGCAGAGFTSLQLVQVHFIMAFTPMQPPVSPEALNQQISKLLPPGCLVMVFRRKASVSFDTNLQRSIALEKETVTFDIGSGDLIEWASQQNQTLTVYEIYVVTQIGAVPDVRGAAVLTAIAAAMRGAS